MSDLRQRCEDFLISIGVEHPDRIDKLEAFARELVGTWTNESPKQPGYFWYRGHKKEPPSEWCIFQVYYGTDDGEHEDKLFCSYKNMLVEDMTTGRYIHGQWAGPIDEPEEKP